MKRLLCTALVAVMILSALIAIAVTPAAADDEVMSASTDGGDWKVYADAGSYVNDDGNLDYTIVPEESIVPAYGYSEDGFFATADYKSPAKQRFNIMTKEKYNLQEGITLTVRVDDFAYGGDWWFSFSVWDSPVIAQGDASGKYGQGLFGLLRGNVNRTGKVSWTKSESYISDQSYYNTTVPGALEPGSASSPMVFSLIDFGNDLANIPPQQDENGDFILNMEITYDADTNQYGMIICGVPVTQAVVDQYFKYRFADGMAYIGFSVFGSKSDCTTRCTITEFNGEKPTGTDAGEATGTPEDIGEIIDSSTIEDDQPALYFDGANANGDFKKTGKFSATLNLNYNLNNDNTFTIYPTSNMAVGITITPRNAISYEAADFPYIAVLLRDYCSCIFSPGENDCYEEETVSIYYCAGNILGPDAEHLYSDESMTASWEDEEGHNYKLFIFYMDDPDFTPDWEGRINQIQIIFNNLVLANDGQNHFDFCYAGYFKDDIAAEDFAAAYVDSVVGCAHEHTEVIPGSPASCQNTGLEDGVKCLDCGKIVIQQVVIPITHVEGTPATCTDPAVCSECNKTFGSALGHDFQIQTRKEPTCTEAGWEVHAACSRCGLAEVEGDYSIPATGHTPVTVPGYAATCTTPGMTDGTKCGICNTPLTEGTATELAPHTSKVVAGKAPTCTEAGLTEGAVCSKCNAVITAQEEIEALGHEEVVVPGYAATCTSTGLTNGSKCSRCNQTVVEQTVIEMLAHDWSAAYTYDDEYHWNKCSDCDATTEKVAHNIADGAVCICGYGCAHENTTWAETVPPTCSATGRKTETCADCGTVVNTETVAKLPHTAGDAATCTQAQTCTVCGEIIVAATGHTPGAAATCKTAQTCTVCAAVIAPETGVHTPGAEATCTEAQVCTGCGTVLEEATGHTPGAAATCTDAQTCTTCGTELVAATGHTAGPAATCTAAQVCLVCNAELAAAIGHTPGDAATCSAAQTCTVCGEIVTEKLAHTPGAAATCVTNQVCTVCNIEIAPIAADAHVPGAAATCAEAQTCTLCHIELAAKTAHTPGPAATCTVNQTCTVCNEILKGAEHTWNEDKTKCTVCGETRGSSNNKPTATEPTTNKPTEENKTEEKKGCGSVVGFSALAVLGSIALAGTVCFKKKED